MPVRRTAPVPALLLLLAALGACASTGGSTPARYATLVVENDATLTVNVYALRQGNRVRIGSVTSLSTAEFPLRNSLLSPGGDLELVIDPVGSRRQYPTRSIHVTEGSVIELTVSSFIR